MEDTGKRRMGMLALQEAVTAVGLKAMRYFEYQKTFEDEGQICGAWELVCVDRGTMLAGCGAEEFRMNAGEVMLYPPGQLRQMRMDAERPSYVLTLAFDAQSMLLKHLAGRVLPLSEKARERLDGLITECRRVYSLPMEAGEGLEFCEDAPLGGGQMVRIHLEMLLIHLLREHALPGMDDDEGNGLLAGRILDLLRANLRSPLTIEEVSAQLGVGKSVLSEAFGKTYGCGIMHYHAQMKIEEAKRLLADQKLSVAETARMLGFASPQYFSRRFSQLEGISPREFIRGQKTKV